MKPALRFDAREIAVIFSLFIFVSLLMFTVGILVGKGLTQARYEGKLPAGAAHGIEPLVKHDSPHSGASVSLGAPKSHGGSEHGDAEHAAKSDHATAEADPGAPTEAKHAAKTEADHGDAHAEKPQTNTAAATPSTDPSLKLIPLKTPPPKATGTSLSDPTNEAEALLKNPKILSLIEPEVGETEKKPETKAERKPERKLATATPSKSAPTPVKETYTVQVGSYPDETAARERVDALKKMGYAEAFFSSKELGSANGTWYRVWLGNYPNYASAKKTGDALQAKGEVKGYIVRKAD